ncbi:uncharacterized protein LOC134746695 [Cydia strobilella]|uniref:uncharacterized protein LOC134746695 n=1 Tax=Cydia strobilella TaxID=1100964 RepID=UPI003007310F
MSDYIEAVMRLVQQLADIDKTIEDDEVAEILLSGLPQEFDNLVSGLETACLTSKLSSEVVRTRLLQEEHRRNGEENATALHVKKKSPLYCSFCKRNGHTVKRCFKKKREEQKDPHTHSMYASANAACSEDAQDFIVDSGSTSHMCSNKDLFSETQGKRHEW